MALRHLRGLAIGVTLLATAVLAGCGGSDTTDPEDTISGQYLFRTVNGTPVPFWVVVRPGLDPSTVEYVWGGITLTDNGTDGGSYKIEWLAHWVGSAANESVSSTGTYVRFGVDDIGFLCDGCAVTNHGKIKPGRVTMTAVGIPIMLASGRNTQVQLSPPIVEGPPWVFVWEK